jgi:hypothetical protein
MEPQQRRPRPNLDCSAIGWMDVNVYEERVLITFAMITLLRELGPLEMFMTVFNNWIVSYC